MFAFLLGVGFLLLLARAERANALELRSPVSATPVRVVVEAPLVGLDADVPAVAHVSSTPPAAPVAAHIKVAVAPPAVVANIHGAVMPTLSRVAPMGPSLSGARPARVEPTPATPPQTPESGATAKPTPITARDTARDTARSLPSVPAPAPAPRPALPTVPASSSSLEAGGGGTSQPAAVLAAVTALLILLPFGVSRRRRLRLPTIAFTPLARPG